MLLHWDRYERGMGLNNMTAKVNIPFGMTNVFLPRSHIVIQVDNDVDVKLVFYWCLAADVFYLLCRVFLCPWPLARVGISYSFSIISFYIHGFIIVFLLYCEFSYLTLLLFLSTPSSPANYSISSQGLLVTYVIGYPSADAPCRGLKISYIFRI